jgi:hypothetical protein
MLRMLRPCIGGKYRNNVRGIVGLVLGFVGVIRYPAAHRLLTQINSTGTCAGYRCANFIFQTLPCTYANATD